MKIYNVLVADRHVDIVIHNFRGYHAALDFALKSAQEWRGCNYNWDTENYNPETQDGWIICYNIGTEGDYITVIEGDLK